MSVMSPLQVALTVVNDSVLGSVLLQAFKWMNGVLPAVEAIHGVSEGGTNEGGREVVHWATQYDHMQYIHRAKCVLAVHLKLTSTTPLPLPLQISLYGIVLVGPGKLPKVYSGVKLCGRTH